jgi:3-oxoacyl-[acyl-carrier protein] reductase
MHDSPHRLDGQWAVVTGSTSGIGKAIALQLADAGAHLIIHGRDAQRAAEVAATVKSFQRDAAVVVTDFNAPLDFEEFVADLWHRQPVDLWVNNAGVDVLTGDAAHWSFGEKLARLWAVDVRGTIDLSRAVGRRMRDRGHGAIINIGWDQAETGMAGDSGEMFAATKGAVMDFTRSLAKSLAPQVRVNCVAPGWIRTAWGQSASDAWQRRAVGESLVARWGEAEDVARTVRFLATPAASFINGQIIAVNGGRADGVVSDANDWSA